MTAPAAQSTWGCTARALLRGRFRPLASPT